MSSESDLLRYRYGNTQRVDVPVDSAVVIEKGDLCYLDTDDVKPASSQADGGTEDRNQETFAQKFLGVAMRGSASGETDAIPIATSGVFEFPCPSGTWEVGDLVGIDEAASGTALDDQQVCKVTLGKLAIGRCVRRAATATTRVRVEIFSRVVSPQLDDQYDKYGIVYPAVDSGTVIAVGDLLYLDTDDAKPASAQADQLSKAANQDLFASKFLGVALRASADGETAPIPVATRGIFTLTCASATFELGDVLGVDEASGGTALEDQKVAAVALPQYAICRVVKREPVAVTSVLVEIVSTVMAGGVEGQTYTAP